MLYLQSKEQVDIHPLGYAITTERIPSLCDTNMPSETCAPYSVCVIYHILGHKA